MRKSQLLLLMTLLMASLGAVNTAEFSEVFAKHFKEVVPIQGIQMQEECAPCMLTVPPKLLDKLVDAGSFRIFDQLGKEIPSLIFNDTPKRKDEEVHLSLFNQVQYKSASTQMNVQSLEFGLPENFDTINGGITSLVLQVEEDNFQREVALFGKNGQQEDFKVIAQKLPIIGISDEKQRYKFKHTKINFLPQKFSDYKLEINIPENAKAITITAVSLKKVVEIGGSQYKADINFKRLRNGDASLPRSLQTTNQRLNKDFFELSLLTPVESLEFSFAEKWYKRFIEIYQYLEKEHRYSLNPIATAYLFNFEQQKNLELALTTYTASHKLLLVIHQENNSPIVPKKIIGKIFNRKIIFFTDSIPTKIKLPLTLYIGSEKEIFPYYDINERWQRVDKTLAIRQVKLGDVIANKEFIPGLLTQTPVTEKSQYLIYCVVIFLAIFLWGYFVKIAKKN